MTIRDRDEYMRCLYEQGYTLIQIGDAYSITSERVRQILTRKFGITAKHGGAHVRRKKHLGTCIERRDTLSRKKWGCSYDEYRALWAHPDKPTYAYQQSRRNARSRGFYWTLTLWQWWDVWQKSGHWGERSRGGGYCMCRVDFKGHYTRENVRIIYGDEASKEYQDEHRHRILYENIAERIPAFHC